MERAKLHIAGMSCGHCVGAVERALKGIAGVEVEQVGIGSAVVAYDGDAVPAERLDAALTEAGYRVERIEVAT